MLGIIDWMNNQNKYIYNTVLQLYCSVYDYTPPATH